MSTKHKGTVAYKGFREIKGRKYWSFALEGEDKVYYRTGVTDPKFDKGDAIEFTFDKTQYGNEVDVPSIKKIQVEKQTSNAGNASPTANSDIRQLSISYQGARNAAIEVVNYALTNGILVLAGKAKGEKFDLYVAEVEKVAEDFFFKNVDQEYLLDIIERKREEADLAVLNAAEGSDDGEVGSDD